MWFRHTARKSSLRRPATAGSTWRIFSVNCSIPGMTMHSICPRRTATKDFRAPSGTELCLFASTVSSALVLVSVLHREQGDGREARGLQVSQAGLGIQLWRAALLTRTCFSPVVLPHRRQDEPTASVEESRARVARASVCSLCTSQPSASCEDDWCAVYSPHGQGKTRAATSVFSNCDRW